MKKEIAVIWICPIVLFSIISLILFIIKFNRPVSGLTIGLIIGFVFGALTKLIYDDFYRIDLIKGFRKFDQSNIQSFEDIIKVPYYFFYIWLALIIYAIVHFLKYFLIIGGIGLIIYLLIRAIIKGL